MNKLFLIASLLASVFLLGCVRIPTGTDARDEQSKTFFSFEEKYGLFYSKPAQGNSEVNIVDNKSYGLSPRGVKVYIQSKPYQFDIEQKYAFVRRYVELFNNKHEKIDSLNNGKWQFFFTLDDNGVERQWDFSLNVSDWYYSPFIHGAPN
jgi:hypothetical protein